jgi:hypothetical protein
MKKIWLIVLLAIGMIACTERNTPTDTTGTDDGSGDTGITDDDVDDQTWSDTIQIVWNGASATISGANDSLSITNSNGYVTVNSSVTGTRIVYLLSGNGTGQLTIYGTYRHNITLNGLTLSCSDGPAINNQCHKKCYLVVNGTNTLTDGSSYASSSEDRKAAFFSEGQIIASGAGALTVKGNYKHALASDDYIHLTDGLTGTLHLTAASDGLHANDGIYINGGNTTIQAGNDGVQCDSIITISGGSLNITATDKGIVDSMGINISGGTIVISSEYKCIKTKANLLISGGDIQVICTGTASSGNGWGGGSSSSSSPEGIEAKGTITITGGKVFSQSADDAINSGGDLTISGGLVMAYSTGNDGIDANGDCYIQGGTVYAIGARSPEVAIDANTEERKQLYVQGGTIVAIGGLESGASLTQSCYSASSVSKNTWYALYSGSDPVFVFKTPSSLSSSTFVVSTNGTVSLKSGVTTSGGTAILNSYALSNPTVSGGSAVSLSSYTGGNQGGPGGGPGGPGGW